MPLNEMSLDELVLLTERLNALREAGRSLENHTYEPIFDLTPGKPVTITLPFRMPEAPARSIYLSEGPATAEAIDAALKSYGTTETLAEVLERQDQNDAEHSADLGMIKRRLSEVEVRASAKMDWTPERPIVKRAYRLPNGVIVAPEGWSLDAAIVPGTIYELDIPPVDELIARTVAEAATNDEISADPSRSEDEAASPTAAQGDEASPKVSPVSTEDPAESGGGQASAAAEPPAAPRQTVPGIGAPIRVSPLPVSGSVTHEKTFSGAPVWTAEEDARLIELVAGGMVRLGLGKTAAIRAAAAELGRPEQGTAFRCHHKLKNQIGLAVETFKARVQADTTTILAGFPPEPTQIPEGPALATATDGTTASYGDAAGVGDTLPAAQDEDLDAKSRAAAIAHGNGPARTAIWAHVTSLPRKDGWTLQRDIDLLELAILGWLQNEISLELGVQAKLIKPRLDLLTGLYKDEADRQVRLFKREDVLSALKALQAEGRAA